MEKENSFFIDPGNFDDLIQSGFRVIPKITFATLCKLFYDVIIIPVSSDLLNLDTTERKEQKLQKTEYLVNKKKAF